MTEPIDPRPPGDARMLGGSPATEATSARETTQSGSIDRTAMKRILRNAERRFVIGLDLDGVCADYTAGIKPLIAEWVGVNPDQLPNSYSYNYPEWGVRDEKHLQDIQRFGVTQRNFFTKLKPMNGAPPALRRLSDAGAHIRIITYRLFIPHFHAFAAAQTVRWLERHGIPYWDLCFMREKGKVDAQLYIEDSPSNIAKLQEQDQDVVIFDNPTNGHIQGTRARNWAEVERIVMEKLSIFAAGLEPVDSTLEPSPDPDDQVAPGTDKASAA